MSTHVWESGVINSPINKVWEILRPLSLTFLPNVLSSHCEAKSTAEVGAVTQIKYMEGTVQRINLLELSDQHHTISWDLIESDPPALVMSSVRTVRLRRVTDTNSTFVEWVVDFSSDCTQEVIQDARFKGHEFINALGRAAAATPAKRILFIGPPGCGKGTQAPRLKEAHGLAHLATGDMLRAAVSAGTDNGKRAKAAMDGGQLVSDDIVVGIVRETIGDLKNGFILDGFPRTLQQAQMLDKTLQESKQRVDLVVEFAIPDSVLVNRITGRLIHKASGRSYHRVFNPPRVEGKDDVTGEPLEQRSDDNASTLVSRLQAYHQQTTPVLDYYRSTGALKVVNANGPLENVYRLVDMAVRGIA